MAHTETTNLTRRPLCDLCKLTNTEQWALADANVNGSWGYVCNEHFRYHKCRLGLGFGQLLIIDDNILTDEIDALRKEAN